MMLSVTYNNTLYVYNENIWTGKKELRVNGINLSKTGKNTFYNSETKEAIIVKGSMITGVKLEKMNETIVLAENTTADWIFIFLPLLIICVGIFGGAIGGAISGGLGALAMYVNASIVRKEKNIVGKAVLSIAVTIGVVAIFWFLYTSIVGALF